MPKRRANGEGNIRKRKDGRWEGRYTVGSWLEVWLENYAKIKLRPSTYKTHQGFLKNHIQPNIGNIPLSELTSLDLQKFYKHLLEGGRVDHIEAFCGKRRRCAARCAAIRKGDSLLEENHPCATPRETQGLRP